MKFADELVGARRGSGLTQAQLAALAHTSQSRLSSYESGVVVPTEATRRRLLAAARPLPRMALYQHRAAVRRMAKKCKCVNVRVFGSVARGEDTYRSDIDLVVTPMAGASLFDLAGFAEFVEELTGYHVDVVSDRGRNADDPIVVESLAV